MLIEVTFELAPPRSPTPEEGLDCSLACSSSPIVKRIPIPITITPKKIIMGINSLVCQLQNISKNRIKGMLSFWLLEVQSPRVHLPNHCNPFELAGSKVLLAG